MVLCLITWTLISAYAIRRLNTAYPARKPSVSCFPTATIIAPVAQHYTQLASVVMPETGFTIFASAPVVITDETPVATLSVEPSPLAHTIDASLDTCIPAPSILTASHDEQLSLWSDGEGYYADEPIPYVTPVPYGWDNVNLPYTIPPAPQATVEPTITTAPSKPARKPGAVKPPVGKTGTSKPVKKTTTATTPLHKRTVSELRRDAKARGIKGYSAMKKQELIDQLTINDKTDAA